MGDTKLKEFARVGRFVVVSLVSFSLSQAHLLDAHASQSVQSQRTPADGQSTSANLKTMVKLPYRTPIITSHKSFNFEVKPSSPTGNTPPPRTPSNVKGATSPVTGLPEDMMAIEGGVLLAVGSGLMLYGRKKSSQKSAKEEENAES